MREVESSLLASLKELGDPQPQGLDSSGFMEHTPTPPPQPCHILSLPPRFHSAVVVMTISAATREATLGLAWFELI